MTQQALGLIETCGLVAAIKAADTALKTAEVELVSYEKVFGGLVTVAVIGEVAAVQAAVAAGSAAAAEIGELVSQHVIARPMADVSLLIKGPGTSTEPPGPESPSPDPLGPEGSTDSYKAYLDSLGVEKLRQLARKTKGIAIKGREISRANKEQLIIEILKARIQK